MPVLAVPGIPEIRLHTATPVSRLRTLSGTTEAEPGAPYWAYRWAGGLALARYVLDHPEVAAGRRVLDLGAGSGLVAIAAAKAGAARVQAAEVDAHAIAALHLNAAENDVAIQVVGTDMTGGAAPDVDTVLVGDLFYDLILAARVTMFLDRCRSAGIAVLIGDPWRTYLPCSRLVEVARYDVSETNATAMRPSGIFRPKMSVSLSRDYRAPLSGGGRLEECPP